MAEQALIEYINSETFIKASANATRLVAKLKTSVQNRELYETHQILRTIYFRFINVREKVAALESLLYYGSCYLLELQEFVSGQDLATLFLESAAKCLQTYRNEGGEEARANLVNPSLVHHRDTKTMDWRVCDKVASIATQLPESEIGKSKFIADAMRILNSKLLNTNLFHDVMANKFWQNEDFVNSRYHHLHCASIDNAQDVAESLVDYQTRCASKSEVDLFITQFILQFLCLQTPADPPKLPSQRSQATVNSITASQTIVNRRTRNAIKQVAEKIFSTYTLKHPELSQARTRRLQHSGHYVIYTE